MLLGLVDVDYKLIYVDTECKRWIIDGVVFQDGSVSKSREEISLNITAARIFPGGNEALPFAVVADDAFSRKGYLIKS